MARHVSIVPHTHWDREWYSPFQTFRMRLVTVVDELLDRMERDPSYTRFLLDGQMAVVDDYLEVRPEAEARIRRLATAGRLSVGPWYILMDEFLVSGETIVRDLQMGLERAGAFGGAMPVGYLPDMFGHIAQMPQILRLAGFEHAVVWRGVPSQVDRTGFWWRAPDGSTVRAEYLVSGYGVGGSIPEDAKALVRRVAEYERELEGFLVDGLLYMNGNDHEAPQPWLGRVVAEANDLQDDYELRVSSLPEYLAEAPTEGLPTWSGELRSGARANLLMGVGSNRVDVKQAAAAAERAVERMAEPLAALYVPAEQWPARLLELAWRELVRNAAHDSICACSVDEVCNAVVHRFAEARQIGDGLAKASLSVLATSLTEAGPFVANPSSFTRSGLVEVDLPGSGEIEGAQLLRQRGEVLGDLRLRAAELDPLMNHLRSQQIDASTFINAVDVTEDEYGLQIELKAGPRLLAGLVMEEIKTDLRRRIEGRPDLSVRVLVTQQPTRRVLMRAEEVPGYGWKTLDADGGPLRVSPVRSDGPAVLDNGLVRVMVDDTDGTFSINGVAGFDRLVDGGDHGDTYNYSPPEHDAVVDRPQSVTIELLEDGPLRGRLLVTRRFVWPERIDDSTGSRVGEQAVEVRTGVEVRAGDPLVRVHTTLDNRCRDHRLRAHFPLPVPAEASHAECAFAVVERPLVAEGGPTERALATYPSRRFVHAGGLTVFHDGLLEYELLAPDGAEATDGPAGMLALTLLRVTAMLSRVEMAYRPLGAGPPIRTEGSQMQGRVEARYALLVEPQETSDWGRLYRMVDDALLPLAAANAPGGGSRPRSGAELSVAGAVVSSLRRADGTLELRVFNPSADPATVAVEGRSGWTVDLRGRPLQPFDGSVELRGWEIATLRLTEN
ncbi:MAG TPA: glycoside hydrolase family 38 C-terminal domain-containing protein [Acidimicrobiales bacterium]|nr:glycoside hydrolase family 38 C-terminal domain-containing protein [Acidimicrobiales bacterium]